MHSAASLTTCQNERQPPMSSNELAVHTDDMFSDARVQMIRDQVAKDAPAPIFAALIDIARRRRLDPLAKQISLIRFKSNWTIITTIDGYRALAEQTGQYAGSDAPVFTYSDPPRVNGTKRTEPETVTVTVYKLLNGRAFPFSATIFFQEYTTNSNNWLSMPHTMGAKVAESHALRKAFPAVMSGLYTSEEMEQATVDTQTGEIHDGPKHIVVNQQSQVIGTVQRLGSKSAAAAIAKAEKPKGPHVPPKGMVFYDPEQETTPETRKKVLGSFAMTLKDAGMDENHRHALAWGAGYDGSTTNVPSEVLKEWQKRIKAKPEVWKARAEELMIDMIAEQENLAMDEQRELTEDLGEQAFDDDDDVYEGEYMEEDES